MTQRHGTRLEIVEEFRLSRAALETNFRKVRLFPYNLGG